MIPAQRVNSYTGVLQDTVMKKNGVVINKICFEDKIVYSQILFLTLSP